MAYFYINEGDDCVHLFDKYLYADPLFVDQYAGCLVSPNLQMEQCSHHYCVATKFLDDKLLQKVKHINGVKQVLANNYKKEVRTHLRT